MAHDLLANLYNPHEQTKEQLIAGFVVRRQVFAKLYRELATATMQYPEQHYLIEGQRGSGKTTLLLRLSYAMENDAAVNTWLLPIVFKEEAYYGIFTLTQLWLLTAQLLEERDSAFVGLAAQMEAVSEARPDDERGCFELFINALDRHGKKIVLFIDNIVEMFRQFEVSDARYSHRLREILMTCPQVRLVGASAVTLEAFFGYDHAFYEFFKKLRLEGLNQDETYTLLRELAKVYDAEETIRTIITQYPGRVASLRLLTGGVIRTMVLLFEIFLDATDGDAMTDLEHLLDRVTPLYQHRMGDLAPHQREMMNVIALHWDAISLQDVAEKTRRPVEEVSTMLHELEQVLLIQRAASDTQQHLYYVTERFFNIWYLMRVAPRRSHTRVRWLVRFLENWYTPAELHVRARQHLQAVTRGGFRARAAYYLTEALSQTGQLDRETEHQMKTATRRLLLTRDKSLVEELSPSDQELLDTADACFKNEDYQQALDSLLAIKNKDGLVHCDLGVLYADQFRDYTQAEHYWRLAVEQGDASAMHNLGVLYADRFNDYEQAERYWRLAVEQGHAGAMHNLGVLYADQFNDYEQAEHYYHLAVEQGHADAMYNLGLLYAEQRNDYRQAEHYWRLAVEQGHAGAMHNLGVLYFETKTKKHEALHSAQLAAEQLKNSSALHILACISLWNNHIDDAQQAARVFMADESFFETHETDIIEYLTLLLAKKRYAEAAEYFAMPHLYMKDRFKPLYYALLYFTKAKDYAILPPELVEPVNDILARVRQMAVDYA